MAKTTERNIVLAASDLFRAHGYAGASMKDLADRVGIQKASLYNYVSSKEDLVARVLDLASQEIFADAAGAGDWRSTYGAMVSGLAAHLTDRRRCVALHLGYGTGDETGAAAEAVRAFFLDCRRRFRDVLAGGMSDEAALDLATDTITMLEGATTWLVAMGDDAPMKRAVRDLILRADAASAAETENRVASVLNDVVGDPNKATAAERVLARRLVEAERRATLFDASARR